MLAADCALLTQWLAVRMYGVGYFSVLTRVAVQTNAEPPSTYWMRITACFACAIASTWSGVSDGSVGAHIVSSVHEPATFASGEVVKCTTLPRRSAPAGGCHGVNTSIS